MKAAGWLSLAGHGGGAIWGHFVPTEESVPLYMQMKPKDPSVPLDTIVQNSEKSRRTLVVVVCVVKYTETHTSACTHTLFLNIVLFFFFVLLFF